MVETANLVFALPVSGDNPFFLTSDGATSTSAPGGGWKDLLQSPRRRKLHFAPIRRLDPADQAERRQQLQPQHFPISSTATETRHRLPIQPEHTQSNAGHLRQPRTVR